VQPSAIWSTREMVFNKDGLDLTQNVIISQGRYALQATIKRIDQLYEYVNSTPGMIDMYIHQDIPDALTDICMHQGIASDILFNTSPRGQKESAHHYKLRIERAKYVRNLLAKRGIDTPILSNKTVRNQLVHIDQHLERALQAPDTGWFFDVAIAYRNQFASPGLKVNFCRTFIASEEIILHLGNEIPVRKLRAEATLVLKVVFGTEPTPPPPTPYHSRRLDRLPPVQKSAW